MTAPKDEQQLRDRLDWLKSRYDSGAVSGATFAVIKLIETELSWEQHKRKCRETKK